MNTRSCLFLILAAMTGLPTVDAGDQTANPSTASILYDNGPLITHPGAGLGGADVSAVQNLTLGLSEYGFCHWAVVNNKVADDFTIADPEGWRIDTLAFFGFQTNSSTQSTYLAVQWWIYDGDPSIGGDVVCSDSATISNGRLITGWPEIYRTREDNMQTAVNRPVMLNETVLDEPCILMPGTYWVVVHAWGTIADCMWYPLVSIPGTPATGNAKQFLGSAGEWIPIMDGDYPQGIPFLIKGAVNNPLSVVPCDSIFFFRAKCNDNGKAQGMVKINGDYGGEIVTFDLDGEPIEVVLSSRLMGGRWKSIGRMEKPMAGFGSHIVSLIDPAGCFDPVSFNCQVDAQPDPGWELLWSEERFEKELPSSTEIIGSYPNPFNPSTTIMYSVASLQQVTLRIYDLLGQEMITLVDEHQPGGVKEVIWDGRSTGGKGVPSGVYFARLSAGNTVMVQRLLLVR